MDETSQLHAELHHRQKINALREEGERLRKELRLRGVDPGAVLNDAGLNAPQFIVQDSRESLC